MSTPKTPLQLAQEQLAKAERKTQSRLETVENITQRLASYRREAEEALLEANAWREVVDTLTALEEPAYVPACGNTVTHREHNGFASLGPQTETPWCRGITSDNRPYWTRP